MAIAAENMAAGRSDAPAPSRPLTNFWQPRYWPSWLLIAWMRLTSLLPWRSAVRLHMGIGRVCWRLMTRHRIIVERNIELCFPKLDADGVRRLVRQHFENLGACLAETSFAWFGRVDQSRIPFVIEGDEHVFAALAKGRGVILYTGHFTPLEICAPVLNDTLPNFAFMFHPRRNELLDEFQRRGRRRSSEISFPRDDVRAMLRALARNAVVWYAPDQYFSSRGSTVLPFLGEPQTVSTATCRLARASGAAVVPFFYRRLADGSGYVLRFEPEVENAGTDDVEAGTRRLLAVLENFIRECPEQYAWTHRRLKHRPTEPAAPEEDSRDTGGSAAPEADAPRRRSIWTTLLAILGVSSFIAVADNGAFFNSVAAATRGDEHQAAIVLSMFLLIGTTLVTFLALAIGRRTFKVVAALLLITAAAAGYFMSNFGVLFDPSMIRNIAETDVREAAPLVTPAFFLHVAAFGLAPAAAVFLLPLGGIGWRRELTVRGSSVLCLSLLLGGTLYANYGPVSFFAQQNHVLRMQMNPVYPLYSLYQYVTRADDKPPAVREPLAATRVVADAQAKPTLFVFVMGETARADRFSLNGYERDTNRFTRPLNVVNFPHVSSCGTSTADSVPCIFSRYGRDGFSHARFASNEPVFQTLKRLGVKTAWLDNSTGCKDICTPATFESLAGAADPALCRDDVCIDEILLTDFAGRIEDDSQDHFIVLHQRGSHGPAYYTDTPRQLKEWLPECDVPSVQNCDLASINNAYDNTILYTDYVLARTISLLQEQSDRFATAMLYVSDHGESLGEKGLYLHGMPYALAPPEQTGVPMIFWASPDFYSSRAINPECLRVAAQEPTSHDAIFHSILSLFDVEAQAYDRGLDLFAGCKSGSMSTSPDRLVSAQNL